MRLHILAGCRALLAPAALPGEQVAGLLGDGIRIATANWLSQRCGQVTHDFLLDTEETGQKDARVRVFAQSLKENFGHRFEPLIILPDLVSEVSGGVPPEHGRRGALELLLEICRLRPAARFVLHALVLPKSVDADGSWAAAGELLLAQARGRLDGLRATLAGQGLDPERIEIRVTEAPRDTPEFGQLLRNAVSCQVARQLRPGFARSGLGTDEPRLEGHIAQILTDWSQAGIPLAGTLGAGELDDLSGRISTALLANVRTGTHA
jgi:hypothetical protein